MQFQRLLETTDGLQIYLHESLEITEVTSTRGAVENVSICYLERKSAKTLGQINQLINEHYR
jgi:hypothetical protein